MNVFFRSMPVLAVLCVLGCGRDSGPVPTHPVSGQVIYGGKPAAGVQVYFLPTSAPMVPVIPSNPHAVTGPDGKFTLTTYTKDDGAAEGGYQVILLWLIEKPDEEDTPDRLLGWYDAIHSTLSVQVKAQTNALQPFRLPVKTKPPEPSKGVPGRN